MLGALFVTVATLQLSLVVGVPKVTLVASQFALALTVTVDGQVIVGFSLSLTMTSNEHVVVLPAVSSISNVFVVVPTGKGLPEDNPEIWVIVMEPQLSEPVGIVYETTAEQRPESLVVVILLGHDIVGAVVSSMTTFCVCVEEFPLPSS